MSTKTGWYEYPGFNAFYKVEGAGNEGRGFRWFVCPEGRQHRYEFFTFEERTAEFIAEALITGQVVECDEVTYLRELRKFLAWVSKALGALDKSPSLMLATAV
jgi:hypothetical protein